MKPEPADRAMVGDQQAARSSRRFAGRVVLVFGIALLAAVLFLAVLLLVASSSTALLDVDRGAANDLHRYALSHPLFTSAMRTLSNLGSTLAWLLIMLVVVGWLLWRRLRRLAAFVAVTELGEAGTRPPLYDFSVTAAGSSTVRLRTCCQLPKGLVCRGLRVVQRPICRAIRGRVTLSGGC